MKIFIDSDFKCHTSNSDGAFREVETANERGIDFFRGKCDAFIEGYRYIPEGESWTNSKGVVFQGEMIAPWKPYEELASAQRQYEADNAALQAAYQEGVNSV